MFKDGRTIEELIEGLKKRTISGRDVEAIRVVRRRDGTLFTLDNWRCSRSSKPGSRYVTGWQQSELRNGLWKFTTTNGGVSIQIRGK
jgi:hypothetical protein